MKAKSSLSGPPLSKACLPTICGGCSIVMILLAASSLISAPKSNHLLTIVALLRRNVEEINCGPQKVFWETAFDIKVQLWNATYHGLDRQCFVSQWLTCKQMAFSPPTLHPTAPEGEILQFTASQWLRLLFNKFPFIMKARTWVLLGKCFVLKLSSSKLTIKEKEQSPVGNSPT